MERYFEGEMPTAEELSKLMVQAIAAGTLTPIMCASVKKGVGVAELLDVLAAAALPPTAVVRKAMKDGDEVTLKRDPAAPLAAQVFKTRIDPFVQKLSFIRMYSGHAQAKTRRFPRRSVRKGIKVGALLDVQGAETQPVEEACAGDIVAVGQVRGLAHVHVAGRGRTSADGVPHADDRPGRGAQEPAATRRSFPAHSTK